MPLPKDWRAFIESLNSNKVDYQEAWQGKLEGDLDGVSVAFIGRRELIQNKRFTGRAQDRADLELLETEL